jgi:hypothetical protein
MTKKLTVENGEVREADSDRDEDVEEGEDE